MKEKTFEELIEEKMYHQEHSRLTKVGKKYMVELLQQVREATISECEKYIENDPQATLDYINGRDVKINLPTDRILTP